MEVEYTLRPKDLQAFTHYHRKKFGLVPTKPPLVAIIGLFGIAIITFVAVPFLLDFLGVFQSERVRDVFVLGILLGYFAMALCQSWWQVWMNRAIWKEKCEDDRSAWATRDVRVILSPDRLQTVGRVSRETYCWSVVWRIAVTREHVFLCLTRSTAIIIPRRAFCDVQHFEEFVALVRQYQQGPKPTGIITSLPPESTAITRQDSP